MTPPITIHAGDCLDILSTLPDNSVDAVITDPPYGLGFMGKAWDDLPPGLPWATECLRVLKPGGHLLAFGGTRTWHRLFCAVEDAGFEMRDSVAWVYGQGFPKSLNVGKDKAFCQGHVGEYERAESTPEHDVRGVLVADVPASEGTVGGPWPVLHQGVQEPSAPPVGTVSAARGAGRAERVMAGRGDAQAPEGELHRGPVRQVPAGPAGDGTGGRVRDGAPASDGPVDRSPVAPVGGGESPRPRPVEQPSGEPRALPVERGSQAGRGRPLCARCGKPPAPVGLGTALKPAFEPIVVARKPLTGTVAGNVLTWGTGALNIDACRVATDEDRSRPPRTPNAILGGGKGTNLTESESNPAGRWPANVCLDGHQADTLDQQSGITRDGTAVRRHVGKSGGNFPFGAANPDMREDVSYGGEGGASRFFPVFRYQAKAPTRERVRTDDGIAHPTVKPLDLMRWLVRLVTPPGGTVLEPFAGSGTTVEACILEGFGCIAIEREPDYLPLIEQRITRARAELATRPTRVADLFDTLDDEATA